MNTPASHRVIRGLRRGLGRKLAYNYVSGAQEVELVTDGLVVHLSADNIEGVADGGDVEVWADQSVEGNHLDGPVVVNFPTFETNEVNSLPVVRFTFLEADGLKGSSPLAGFATATGCTIVCVMKFRAISEPTNMMVNLDDGGTGTRLTMGPTGPALASRVDMAAGVTEATAQIEPPDTNFHLWFGDFDEGNDTARLSLDGGAFVEAVEDPSNLTVGILSVGNSTGEDSSAMDIAEILVYNKRHDAAEIAQIKAYLNNKYNLY